jgi:hypothetical protein
MSKEALCVYCNELLSRCIPCEDDANFLRLELVAMIETENGHVFGDCHLKCVPAGVCPRCKGPIDKNPQEVRQMSSALHFVCMDCFCADGSDVGPEQTEINKRYAAGYVAP